MLGYPMVEDGFSNSLGFPISDRYSSIEINTYQLKFLGYFWAKHQSTLVGFGFEEGQGGLWFGLCWHCRLY
jgi:hypothetical protein